MSEGHSLAAALALFIASSLRKVAECRRQVGVAESWVLTKPEWGALVLCGGKKRLQPLLYGVYAPQLANWVGTFYSHRMLVSTLGHLRDAPAAVLAAAFAHVGVHAWSSGGVAHANRANQEKEGQAVEMTNRTREMLTAFYAEPNRQLRDVLAKIAQKGGVVTRMPEWV